MRPPRQSQVDYERIQKYDEWIPSEIEEIKLEENRRTGFKDDKTGQDKYVDQVRFKFKLAGHEYPHYSRWMTYSFGEKANLYIKYLKQLVAGAQPDMKFDLDLLKGFRCKTMWSQNGDFDNLDQIRPLEGKFNGGEVEPPEPESPAEEVAPTADIPF
jgi:hypothetical protein